MRLQQDDLDGAEEAYRAGLAAIRALADRDPANTEWQRDLGISLSRLGDVLTLRGDAAGAAQAASESLALTRRLADRDPANLLWQRDLLVSLNRHGDALFALSDLAGTEAAYRESLAIAQRLAARDPASVEAAVDLAIGHYKVSFVTADPRPDLDAARTVLETLQAEGRLPPYLQGLLTLVQDRLASLPPRPEAPCSATSSPPPSSPPPPPPALADGRVALVIGTSRYDQLTDLPNPRSDAAALAEALSDLGFDVTEETNPDTEDLRDALADFAEDAAGAGVALVFYAGHGVEIAGENRLLPTDATADSLDALAATSLALTDIAQTLSTLAPAAILIVDACRNDPFSGTPLADATRAATALEDPALEDPTRPIAPGFARVGPAKGLLYAFSTAPGDVASDGPEGANSPFTAALLRHLAKPGLELRTVLTLVTEDVHDRTRGAQTPYFESGLPELVFAAGQPADLSERDALLLAMADLSPDLRDQVETLAATRAMPLAPLYAALLTLPPDTSREDRDRALTEAADAYASCRTSSPACPKPTPAWPSCAGRPPPISTSARPRPRKRSSGRHRPGRSGARGRRDLYLARTLSQAETHVLSSNSSLAELDRESAIQSLKAASELFEEAYQLDSSDATLQMVTETLWAIGEIYHYNLDDIDRALEYYGRMEAVIAAKLKVDPESLRWRRELAAAQNVLGDASMRRDDFEEALKWFSLSAEVSRELFSDDPQNDQYRRDLAVAYIKMSDVTLRLDDVPAAGEFASKAVGLMADRAERMPDSASVLADLASSQERMGDIAYYSSSGEFAAALAAYQLSLENWRRVVLLEPEADIYLRNLATTQGRVGDAEWQLNLLDDAETSYAGSLAALQNLPTKIRRTC